MKAEIPDVVVELLLLGELPADEAKAVRDRLERTLDPRLRELEAENVEMLSHYPASQIEPRIRRKLESTPSRRRYGPWLVAAGTAVAVVGVVWWLSSSTLPDQSSGRAPKIATASGSKPAADGVRIKGPARLLVHRRTGTGSKVVTPGEEVTVGETIQLGYESGRAQHGVILSIDGAGGVTLHWPPDIGSATTLTAGRVWLEYSFQLDAAPGFERFVFVTADAELDTQRILDAATVVASGDVPERADLPLDAALSQSSFLVHKSDPSE